MKKIFLVLLLTMLGYGFSYSTICKVKYSACIKENIIKKKSAKALAQEKEDIEFHPLIFIAIAFK